MMSTTLIVLLIATGLCVFIGLLFPLGALFGAFETRKNNAYVFKMPAYFMGAGIVVATSFAILPLLVYGIAQLTIDGSKHAEKSVRESTVAIQIGRENISALNSDIQKNDHCYAAAVSRWIEDRWNAAYREESCKKQKCAANEKEFFDLERRAAHANQYNLLTMAGITLGIREQSTEMTWAVAKNVYDGMRSFMGILDPSQTGQKNIGTDQESYGIYRGYIDRCASLEPAPWTAANAPVVTYPASFCMGSNCP